MYFNRIAIMNRRKFLRDTSAAGLALTALELTACSSQKASNSGQSADPLSFDLNEVSIDELRQKMQAGTYTARSIASLYLARIEAIDKSGPGLRSVIELNPDALAIADEMDRERKQGKIRGPLHGIPVLIKDNIDTADKMMTTAGSIALEGHRAAKDAF